jgi:hypothetical protein
MPAEDRTRSMASDGLGYGPGDGRDRGAVLEHRCSARAVSCPAPGRARDASKYLYVASEHTPWCVEYSRAPVPSGIKHLVSNHTRSPGDCVAFI